MSYTAEQLLSLANSFEEFTSDSLVKSAKKKDEKKKFPFWLKNKGKKDSNSAKDKSSKKLDPKAEVRNRGDVCVPAEKAKDKKDHFPINSESQARNALAQVNKFTNAPEWYNGSLQSLVSLVAKKVKAKYPSIEVSKDAKTPGKKKASAYYNGLLKKFSQVEPKAPKGTPGNPYTKEELGEDPDVIDLDKDEEGNPIRQPVSVTRDPRPQPAKPRFGAIPPDVQEALHKLKYVGKDTKPLVRSDGKGDGQLGPNTQFALEQYIAKNKDRIPKGLDQIGSALFEMIKRDASGENKTKEQMFDVKTANDSLNAAQAYLTQLEVNTRSGQLNVQNAAQSKQGFDQYMKTLYQHPSILGIYSTLQDNRSSQQERDSATQMQKKYDGLRVQFERWSAYLDMLAKQAPAAAPAPATAPPTTAALENEFFRKLGSKYIY